MCIRDSPETVTVTASVDQSDIASVSIGESVTVEISDHGTFRGTVSKINPVSQSNSKSSIYYSAVSYTHLDVYQRQVEAR